MPVPTVGPQLRTEMGVPGEDSDTGGAGTGGAWGSGSVPDHHISTVGGDSQPHGGPQHSWGTHGRDRPGGHRGAPSPEVRGALSDVGGTTYLSVTERGPGVDRDLLETTGPHPAPGGCSGTAPGGHWVSPRGAMGTPCLRLTGGRGTQLSHHGAPEQWGNRGTSVPPSASQRPTVPERPWSPPERPSWGS